MIIVCPASQLEDSVARYGVKRVLTLTSGGLPTPRPAGVAAEDHLTVTFHDLLGARDGHVAPGAAHVAEALAFAARDDLPLLVHCYAGVSRSPAMAYAIACARAPDRDEAEIAQELRRLSPSATPNALVVALADDALGRGGRMRAAIAAIGRGEDAFEGEVFVLPTGPVR
ncbi:putative protein tyrosine phosphatase [Methylopila capsulata]|uniref:Protein-tyrosine-phosphatase n=1 Tax=Methylopila capsulata TaxID=61654 RepID=A0A9W6MSW9_9HYPH|nr:protein tyrosine phosphatase [Methylopila capsulata]MBM7852277.1 putative protein tyrosine phosphatase [Methylopila capsulata]GLK56486.1 protein-tyrosine-phosphatase [Methylopila capsulata]